MEQLYVIKLSNGNFYNGLCEEGMKELIYAWQFDTYRDVYNLSMYIKESHIICRLDCRVQNLVEVPQKEWSF